MNHTFNIELANKYGIEEALILERLASQIANNITNKHYIFDNNCWVCNSIRAWRVIFPYITESKIKRCLRLLEDCNVILSANRNKNAYNKTKWYAVTDKEICKIYNITLNDTLIR